MSNALIAWIGPITAPFDWVFENCVERYRIRRWRDHQQWLSETNSTRSEFSQILYALPNRDIRLIEAINSGNRLDPIVSVGAILGDLWLGHRRSSPRKLEVPSFYWWNLQDQVLPWLARNTTHGSLGTFHSKLASTNDYWQRSDASLNQATCNKRCVLLTANERVISSLNTSLEQFGIPIDVVHLLSDLPEKQLEQLASSRILSTQLSRLFEEARHNNQPVDVWWCGGTMDDATLASIAGSLSRPLEKLLITWRRENTIRFGWFATLPDVKQWEWLRKIGFSQLLAHPYRIDSLSEFESCRI